MTLKEKFDNEINLHAAKCVELLEMVVGRELDVLEKSIARTAFSFGMEARPKIEGALNGTK